MSGEVGEFAESENKDLEELCFQTTSDTSSCPSTIALNRMKLFIYDFCGLSLSYTHFDIKPAYIASVYKALL